LIALDFHKLDGYKLLKRLLNHKNAEMRTMTCDLIGTCAQNNLYNQETLLADNFLVLLLNKLENDENQVKVKALFAISCKSIGVILTNI
jgi:hypothetical protein